jgi:hypothetical protein
VIPESSMPPDRAAFLQWPAVLPACDAPDKFTGGDDDGPPKRVGEIRRHVYRGDERGVRVKIKTEAGGASYRSRDTGLENLPDRIPDQVQAAIRALARALDSARVDRLAVLLLDVVKDQQKRIEALEAKMARCEAAGVSQ